MQKDDWKPDIELDAWTNELERISIKNYKTADTAIFKAYKETLEEMKEELREYVENYETLTFSQKMDAQRVFRNAARIDEMLDTNFKVVGQEAVSYKTAEGALGYNGTFYTLEGKENLNFTMDFGLDEKFLEQVVKQPVAGKRLSTRLYKNRDKLAREATNLIIRETSKGKGYGYIAKRLSDMTEASYKQSMRIARTEAGRVRSITTQKGYDNAKKLGVNELQKKWVSGLDSRTRATHGAADGQTVDHDEKFHVGDSYGLGPRMLGDAGEDINCRCTTVPVIGSVDPELRRVDGEISDYITYTQWAKRKKLS